MRIVYTEPEFHMWNPHTPEEYSCRHDCPAAGSVDEAVREAVNEFRSLEERSWVNWRRVIKSVTVEPF